MHSGSTRCAEASNDSKFHHQNYNMHGGRYRPDKCFFKGRVRANHIFENLIFSSVLQKPNIKLEDKAQ